MHGATRVLATALLGASVWACSPRGAPPPPGSRESAAAADPSVAAPAPAAPAARAVPELPELLSATGLYHAVHPSELHPSELHPSELHGEVIQFAPQYPLWSDGATKRRFLRLPPGATIDASKPDAWVFPVGTRFWKEFSFGRRVETRYIERRADGSWAFASYVWDAAGRDARLAADAGELRVAPIGATGLSHDVPSRGDCLACHEGVGERAPILGFTALQLSKDRDPLALHAEVQPEGALDLEQLRARGLLTGFTEGPARPGILAENPEARATLGYLHANCASCHNRSGPLADLGLDFEQTGQAGDTERVLASLVSAPSRFRLPGREHSTRVSPGAPQDSVVSVRIGSRNIAQQMPPLGSKVVDQQATKLVTEWIEHMKPRAPAGPRKDIL